MLPFAVTFHSALAALVIFFFFARDPDPAKIQSTCFPPAFVGVRGLSSNDHGAPTPRPLSCSLLLARYSGHATTFEAAVHGFGSAAELRKLKKEVQAKFPPPEARSFWQSRVVCWRLTSPLLSALLWPSLSVLALVLVLVLTLVLVGGAAFLARSSARDAATRACGGGFDFRVVS